MPEFPLAQIYSGHGSSNHLAWKHAVADAAECHDVGADAEGSVFPDDARTVTVSPFGAYPPREVLGVPVDENTYTVADSLSPEERNRILEEPSRRARKLI